MIFSVFHRPKNSEITIESVGSCSSLIVETYRQVKPKIPIDTEFILPLLGLLKLLHIIVDLLENSRCSFDGHIESQIQQNKIYRQECCETFKKTTEKTATKFQNEIVL